MSLQHRDVNTMNYLNILYKGIFLRDRARALLLALAYGHHFRFVGTFLQQRIYNLKIDNGKVFFVLLAYQNFRVIGDFLFNFESVFF